MLRIFSLTKEQFIPKEQKLFDTINVMYYLTYSVVLYNTM